MANKESNKTTNEICRFLGMDMECFLDCEEKIVNEMIKAWDEGDIIKVHLLAYKIKPTS